MIVTRIVIMATIMTDMANLIGSWGAGPPWEGVLMLMMMMAMIMVRMMLAVTLIMRGGPTLGGSVNADFEDDDGDDREGDDLENFNRQTLW